MKIKVVTERSIERYLVREITKKNDAREDMWKFLRRSKCLFDRLNPKLNFQSLKKKVAINIHLIKKYKILFLVKIIQISLKFKQLKYNEKKQMYFVRTLNGCFQVSSSLNAFLIPNPIIYLLTYIPSSLLP